MVGSMSLPHGWHTTCFYEIDFLRDLKYHMYNLESGGRIEGKW